MNLAYLVTQYPKVSHTFVRREILALEARGHRVLRLAIRRPGGIVDAGDAAEDEKTIHCLERSWAGLAVATLWVLATRPGAFAGGARLALTMHRRSRAGLARHLAYLVEACFFLRLLQERPVEHLHAHFGTNSTAVARLLRALGGPPYSFTVHGPDEFDAPRELDLAGKIADAEFAVAISDYTASQLRRWAADEHGDKIHVVRCGVDRRFFEEASPLPRDSRTLVWVGRLSAQKGLSTLIDAAALLQLDRVDVEIVLAGDGELRPVLEERMREHGLGSRVRITGWLDGAGVRDQLRAARALVLPSYAEGLPVVLMEAFALGRPAIATYVAGIPELVRPAENGWLVPAGNVRALAEAMRAVCEASDEQLDKMGGAARSRAREFHDVHKEAARLEALLLGTHSAEPAGTGSTP